MSDILKSIKARLNRLKKIEEEHKKNTNDIQKEKDGGQIDEKPVALESGLTRQDQDRLI